MWGRLLTVSLLTPNWQNVGSTPTGSTNIRVPVTTIYSIGIYPRRFRSKSWQTLFVPYKTKDVPPKNS